MAYWVALEVCNLRRVICADDPPKAEPSGEPYRAVVGPYLSRQLAVTAARRATTAELLAGGIP